MLVSNCQPRLVANLTDDNVLYVEAHCLTCGYTEDLPGVLEVIQIHQMLERHTLWQAREYYVPSLRLWLCMCYEVPFVAFDYARILDHLNAHLRDDNGASTAMPPSEALRALV